MFNINNFLQAIIGFTLLLYTHANDETESIIRQYEELQEIHQEYSELLKSYIAARVNEINTLLGTSSSKWDFIREMNDIQTWWSLDMNRRQDVILAKLSNVFTANNENQAFLDLKSDFKKHLKSAELFWKAEVDKNLEKLRANPSVFKGLIREPIFTTETPPLKLSGDKQPIYNGQIRNLTNIATIAKEIYRASLEQLAPELPDKTNINYISRKTKLDMMIDRMKINVNKLIDSSRIFATERISGDWRREGNENGPSQKDFDKEYENLSKYATNLIKSETKDIKDQLKHNV